MVAPSKPTPLDWSAYPHIFDLVIVHASDRTRLALRATSREARARVDAQLARHIHINQRPAPPGNSPHPSILTLPVVHLGVSGLLHPSLAAADMLSIHWGWRLATLLPKVRVLDLFVRHITLATPSEVGGGLWHTVDTLNSPLAVDHPSHLRKYYTHMSGLLTLRVMCRAPPPPPRDTAFLGVTGATTLPHAREFIAFVGVPDGPTRTGRVPAFPPGVQRVVLSPFLHTARHTDIDIRPPGHRPDGRPVAVRRGIPTITLQLPSPFPARAAPAALPQSIKEVVIIYPEFGSRSPRAARVHLVHCPELTRWVRVGGRLVVVGSDPIPPAPSLRVDQLIRPQALAHGATEFYTRAEYREVVGHAQYRLETVFTFDKES